MALSIFRGITRCNAVPLRSHQIAAAQKFYSTKPSPKESIDEKPLKTDKPVQDSSQEPQPPKPDGKAETVRAAAHQKYADLKTKISESQQTVGIIREDPRGYALNRFTTYVKNYEQLLEKKFPGAMKVYRVFMDGVKFFGRDMVQFVKIRSSMVLNGKEIPDLTREQLELYYQMPRDIRKVTPILVISSIPFMHYVTMPIAYMYPRKLLTHHFWTIQQRSEYAVINLRDRLLYNRNVFRFLQSKLSQIKNDPNYEQWREALGKIGSGVHPTADEIIAVKGLFAEPPYSTRALSYSHIKNLCGLHGIRATFFKKSKLSYRAMCIHHMDMAILREGGTEKLSTITLRDACFSRGLNASNLNNEELVKWLDQWIAVSKHIDDKNYSLLLHLPILITYNHPNNWKLVYPERQPK